MDNITQTIADLHQPLIIFPYGSNCFRNCNARRVPCIAMEALNGETFGRATDIERIVSNNEIMRRETWM
jgi:hypothetical protein